METFFVRTTFIFIEHPNSKIALFSVLKLKINNKKKLNFQSPRSTRTAALRLINKQNRKANMQWHDFKKN